MGPSPMADARPGTRYHGMPTQTLTYSTAGTHYHGMPRAKRSVVEGAEWIDKIPCLKI